MVLAQMASDITLLSRKFDAFLSTPTPVPSEPESSSYKSESSSGMSMPVRMARQYRFFLRGRITKNPLAETKGQNRKQSTARSRFFPQCTLDGGVMALDFFKSQDPSTANTNMRLYTPTNGVRTE